MNTQSITIGICAYNAASTLDEAINSILTQSASWNEVIILNDGSNDETGEVAQRYVRRYPGKVRYIQQENTGIGVARNHILKFAQGDWLGFVDADDIWHPNKLDRQMKCLQCNPGWGALVTRAWSWGAGEDPMIKAPTSLPDEPNAILYHTLEKQLLTKNFDFHPASVIWRTSTLRECGGYGNDRNGEDFAPFLNMALMGVQVGILDEQLYGGRITEGSLTRLSTNHYRGAVARLTAIEAALSRHATGTNKLTSDTLQLLNVARQRFLRWAIYGVRKGFPRMQRSKVAEPLIKELQPTHVRWLERLKLIMPDYRSK